MHQLAPDAGNALCSRREGDGVAIGHLVLDEPGDDLRSAAGAARRCAVPQGDQHVGVPGEVSGMVAWVLKRPGFSRAELDQAFPAADKATLDKFIVDMERMLLIAVAA